jgi:hypothetical protein
LSLWKVLDFKKGGAQKAKKKRKKKCCDHATMDDHPIIMR